MKKIGRGLLVLVLSIVISNSFGQTISNLIFGQNAWMPDTIGTAVYYGKLHKNWGNIAASGATVVRFGGIAPDQNKPTNYQYIKMVDSCRAKGIEPMLQVPYNKGQYTASQAADIVRYVNITKGRNVKYWIIGNEPNLGYGYTSASQLAAYIKPFASAMKAVDPTIKIVGPETAWYDRNTINGLITPGGPDDITGQDANGRYYVDVISFHSYPFSGGQTRAGVISSIMQSYSYNDNLKELNTKIDACNSFHGRTGENLLTSAVTEANVDYQNSASDNLYGVGANSFIGGQFWAEMLAASMRNKVQMVNFWSVVEGNSTGLDIGFLSRVDGSKKPTFYHFQMMSQNFRGTFIDGTDNQANVKVFGSKDGNQVSVMILNQEQGTTYDYALSLSSAPVAAAKSLKINLNAGISKEFTESISAESTTLLVFDLNGNLKRKIEYKLYGNADAGLPPTITDYAAGTDTSSVSATITPSGPTIFNSGGSVTLKANSGTGLSYAWLKDGKAISGATVINLIVNTSGFYSVKVTKGTKSATSASLEVKVKGSSGTTTGVEETTLPVFDIKVVPNPARDLINFKINSNHKEKMFIKIYDMTGKLCIDKSYEEPPTSVETGELLAAGIYIAKITQGDKKEIIKILKSQ